MCISGYESGEGKGEEGNDGRDGGQPRRYRPRRRFEPNNYYNTRPRRPPPNRDSQGQDGVRNIIYKLKLLISNN